MVKEHSSQCNSDQLVVTHNALDLDVDFDTKTISGTVEVGEFACFSQAILVVAVSAVAHLLYTHVDLHQLQRVAIF